MTGDGGFGQYAMELNTAVKYGIAVKHVLLNNNALGKISKEQLGRATTPSGRPSLVQPRLGRLRRALRRHRHPGRPSRDQLDDAMRRLFAADGPALLCVEQDAELL